MDGEESLFLGSVGRLLQTDDDNPSINPQADDDNYTYHREVL